MLCDGIGATGARGAIGEDPTCAAGVVRGDALTGALGAMEPGRACGATEADGALPANR